jgi:hypothetical protein
MLKIITALNGRYKRTRISVMMSSFEINLVCELFMASCHFLQESYGSGVCLPYPTVV